MKNLYSLCNVLLLFLSCSLELFAEETLPFSSASQVYVASSDGDFKVEWSASRVWTFKTAFGKVKLPLGALDSIQFSADGASVDVHTVSGDRWVAEWPKDLIEAVDNKEGRPIEGLRFIHRVVTAAPTTEGQWAFALANQGGFSGNITEQVLKVDGGLSPIDLSVEEIQKVSVINRDEGGLVLRTVLTSGHVYMIKPLQPRIGVADRFGNTLKVGLEDLVSINAVAKTKKVEIPVLAQRIRCTLDGGVEQNIEIPGALIALETAWGNISLSSSELLEMRRQSGSKQVWVQTIYGDVFVGKLSAKTWRIGSPVNLQKPLHVSTRKITQLVFDNSPVYLKNRQWWHLLDGSRVRGQFLRESYRLRINTGEESRWENIPSGGIQLLEPAEDGRIMIASASKRFSIRPMAAEFEMMLDYNGKSYSLPWAQLIRVEKLEEQKASLLDWMISLDPELEEGGVQGQVSEVLIEAGSFWMGRQEGFGLDDEQPAHKVTLNAFYIDQHEVSLGNFRRFVEAKKFKTEAERAGADLTWNNPGFPQEEDEPVVFVSWFDVTAYCNWRSREAGLKECYSKGPSGDLVCDFSAEGYRLPTEAEWEFVASERGARKRFAWGDSEAIAEAVKKANFSQSRKEPFDGFVWTAAVEAFPANALGVYGLSGNVWEWCEDWYHHDAYFLVHRRKPENPVVNSGDAPGLTHKAMRGGSFKNELDFLRCASRGSGLPIGFADRIGFRCVRGIPHSEEK